MNMKSKIYLVIAVMFGMFSNLQSQSLRNQVINSAGGGGAIGTTGYVIYYNIGETVINTIQSTSNTVTQGFLQPDVTGTFSLSVTSLSTDITCKNRGDGSITLTPTVTAVTASAVVNYQYFWSPSSICPGNNCQSVDSLQAGVYSVTVLATYGPKSDTVVINNITINDNSTSCLSVEPTVSNISCVNRIDGSINLTPSVTGVNSSNVSYQYIWTPSSVCTANDCSLIDSLQAGVYSVTVIASYGSQTDTVQINNMQIFGNSNPCMIEVFNGITPNGDGNNDFLYIKNIDQFSNNIVTIFNRWGQQIKRIQGYNNLDQKWDGSLFDNVTAPSGTYFYVIDLGDGSALLKGWIELLNK